MIPFRKKDKTESRLRRIERNNRKTSNKSGKDIEFRVVNERHGGNQLLVKISNVWNKLFSFGSNRLYVDEVSVSKRMIVRREIDLNTDRGRGLKIPLQRPNSPEQGSVYINPSNNKIYHYTGSAWVKSDGTA